MFYNVLIIKLISVNLGCSCNLEVIHVINGPTVLISKTLLLILNFRMNEHATLKMARMARLKRSHSPVTIEELSLVRSSPNPPEGALLSSLTSLLRVWTVRSLDLTECQIKGHFLICLLCLSGPLSIRSVCWLNHIDILIVCLSYKFEKHRGKCQHATC